MVNLPSTVTELAKTDAPSGDNGSDDNFIVLTMGVATLPQYLTPAAFGGTVTFTIAANP